VAGETRRLSTDRPGRNATAEYTAVVDNEPNLFELSRHHVRPVMISTVFTVVDGRAHGPH
jgi:hypothetical protein